MTGDHDLQSLGDIVRNFNRKKKVDDLVKPETSGTRAKLAEEGMIPQPPRARAETIADKAGKMVKAGSFIVNKGTLVIMGLQVLLWVGIAAAVVAISFFVVSAMITASEKMMQTVAGAMHTSWFPQFSGDFFSADSGLPIEFAGSEGPIGNPVDGILTQSFNWNQYINDPKCKRTDNMGRTYYTGSRNSGGCWYGVKNTVAITNANGATEYGSYEQSDVNPHPGIDLARPYSSPANNSMPFPGDNSILLPPVLSTMKGHAYCRTTGLRPADPAFDNLTKFPHGQDGLGNFYNDYGHYVIVYNDNFSAVFAHLEFVSKKIPCKTGIFPEPDKDAPVNIGETIGWMGTTGRSTGFHLHYEIRNNQKWTAGKAVDPRRFMVSKSGKILAGATPEELDEGFPLQSKFVALGITTDDAKVLLSGGLGNLPASDQHILTQLWGNIDRAARNPLVDLPPGVLAAVWAREHSLAADNPANPWEDSAPTPNGTVKYSGVIDWNGDDNVFVPSTANGQYGYDFGWQAGTIVMGGQSQQFYYYGRANDKPITKWNSSAYNNDIACLKGKGTRAVRTVDSPPQTWHDDGKGQNFEKWGASLGQTAMKPVYQIDAAGLPWRYTLVPDTVQPSMPIITREEPRTESPPLSHHYLTEACNGYSDGFIQMDHDMTYAVGTPDSATLDKELIRMGRFIRHKGESDSIAKDYVRNTLHYSTTSFLTNATEQGYIARMFLAYNGYGNPAMGYNEKTSCYVQGKDVPDCMRYTNKGIERGDKRWGTLPYLLQIQNALRDKKSVIAMGTSGIASGTGTTTGAGGTIQ